MESERLRVVTDRYVNTTAGAAAAALEGGCDVDYGGGYASGAGGRGGAQAAVDQGLTSEAMIVAAVRRSLATRMRMGVMDIPSNNPWDSAKLNLGVIDCPEHRSLASKFTSNPPLSLMSGCIFDRWLVISGSAAISSAVLLENAAGKLALPITGLPKGAVIAVLGEGANDTHLMINRYTGTTKHAVSFLAGISSRATTVSAHRQAVVACNSQADSERLLVITGWLDGVTSQAIKKSMIALSCLRLIACDYRRYSENDTSIATGADVV